MREAVFCLCPSGFAQWSQRFYQAAALGCLPVTFWDPRWPNAMPFEREIDYASFSLNVPPAEIPQLRARLEAVARDPERLRRMRLALVRHRPAFDWADLGDEGPLHRTLRELAATRREIFL